MPALLPDPRIQRRLWLLTMATYMIPAGVVGFRGTAQAFWKAEMLLGPLPGGPVLGCEHDMIRMFRYDGPQPLQAPEGLEFLGSFTVIETE